MGALSVAEQDWMLSMSGGRVREFYATIGIVLPDRGGTEVSVRCFANSAAHNREDRNPSCGVNLMSRPLVLSWVRAARECVSGGGDAGLCGAACS